MEAQEFIRKVQEYTGLPDESSAAGATQAVLETLGERLPRKHRDHLAAQLSGELKDYVLKRPPAKPYILEEFYNRVGGRMGVKYHNAVHASMAVSRVLKEAVAPGELNDMLAELPAEYREIFGRKQVGPGSPSSVT